MNQEKYKKFFNLICSDNFLSAAFILFFCMYSGATMLQYTLFNDIKAIRMVCQYLRYIAFAGVSLKIIISIISGFFFPSAKSFKENTKEYLLLAVKYLFIIALTLVVSYNSSNTELIFVLVFLLGVKNVPLNPLFRKTFLVQLLLLCATALSSTIGIIPDMLFDRDVAGVRHSLGFTYPSVMTASVFFTVVLFLLISQQSISRRSCIELIVFDYLLYIVSDSRLSFIMIAALVLFDYFLPKLEAAIQNHKIKFPKIIGITIDLTPVWLCVVTLILCFIRHTPIGVAINSLLSNRIAYIRKCFRLHSISLLGQKINWIGYGGLTDTKRLLVKYNYVDNSYASFLFNYGLIASAFMLVFLVLLMHNLRKKYPKRLTLIAFWIFLYCFIDLDLIALYMNPLLFFGAFLLYDRVMPKKREGKADNDPSLLKPSDEFAL